MRRLVDLAHRAAADHVAELPLADDDAGEPTGAADLERAIEIAAQLGELDVALRGEPRRALQLLDRRAATHVRVTRASQKHSAYAICKMHWPVISACADACRSTG